MKSINRLEKNDEVSENSDAILNEMKKYYEKLYNSVGIENPDPFIDSLKQPNRIKPEHVNAMEKEISLDELLKIIKSLPRNKSPGEDGYPAEFYQLFWIDIKDYLLASYKASFQNKELSITQKRGVLSLIPKKENPLKLKNWRPISLLNQDYKN